MNSAQLCRSNVEPLVSSSINGTASGHGSMSWNFIADVTYPLDRRESQWTGGPFARAMRVGVAIALAGLALAGCGSERQDANEPEGEFTLEVVDASFPARQTTAQHATMRLSVRNTDDRDL